MQEAILEGDDRNFTINFGPQHPAAQSACKIFISVSRPIQVELF
jgi:NADH:ubiquinone oxidoreductase subunit D